MKRWPLVASFILFILLCASIAYWGMQLLKPAPRPVAAPQTARVEARPEAAAALFGGRAANAPVASNYQLKGVVMSGSPKESIAIVGADGKPTQAVRAGAELMSGVTVKEVHRNYVLLSENGAVKRVELPESAKNEGNIAAAAPLRGQPAGPSANQTPRSQPTPPTPSPASPAPAAPPPAVPNAPAAGMPGVPAGTPLPMAPIPGVPTTNPSVPTAPANPNMSAPPTSVVNPPAGAPAVPGQVQRTPQPQGDPRLIAPGVAR